MDFKLQIKCRYCELDCDLQYKPVHNDKIEYCPLDGKLLRGLIHGWKDIDK